jgi:hypothetical protein
MNLITKVSLISLIIGCKSNLTVDVEKSNRSQACTTQNFAKENCTQKTDLSPVLVSVKKSGSQATSALSGSISFEAIFSRAIDPTTFQSSDIVASGCPNATVNFPTTTDSITWSFTIEVQSTCVLKPSIAENSISATDGVGNSESVFEGEPVSITNSVSESASPGMLGGKLGLSLGYPASAVGTYAVDSAGNIVSATPYTQNLDVKSQTRSLIGPGSTYSSVYVSKVNSVSGLLWGIKFDSQQSVIVNNIAVQTSGDIVVAGYFSGTMTIDMVSTLSNLATVTSSGGSDGFFVILSSAGAVAEFPLNVPPNFLASCTS